MPDMNFGGSSGAPSSFLTPRTGSSIAAPLVADTPENQMRKQQLTHNLFATQYQELLGQSTAMRAATLLKASSIDLVDMVGSVLPGIDRGDYWQKFRDAGENEIVDWANQNQDSVGLTSGIIGAVLTDGLANMATSAIATRSLMSGTFLGSTKLGKLATLVPRAKKAAMDAALKAGVDSEMATVLSTTAGKKFLGAKVAAGMTQGAVSEAAIAVVTQNNEQMWSDDASTNLAWMALGVGLGGAVGAIGARYEARVIANSEEVTTNRVLTIDPNFAQTNRVTPELTLGNFADPIKVRKESAEITANMLEARQAIPADASPKAKALLDNISESVRVTAHEWLQKLTNKGATAVPNTGFSVLGKNADKMAAKHLEGALDADPTLMMGIDSVGIGNADEIFVAHDKRAAALKASPDSVSQQVGHTLEKQEKLVMLNGSWMPDSPEARALANHEPTPVKLTPITKKNQAYFEFNVDVGAAVPLKVDQSMKMPGFLGRSKPVQLRLVDAMIQVGKKMRDSKLPYIVPKDADWLQKDFALDFAAKGGTVDLSQIGMKNLDELEVSSLFEKANSQELKNAISNGTALDFWHRQSLNLALPNSLERLHDGTSFAMQSVLNAVSTNPKMTMQEIRQLRAQFLDMNELRTGMKKGVKDSDVTGNLFNFNRDENGEWLKPIIGFGSVEDMTPELRGTRDHAMQHMAENKVFTNQQLTKGDLTKKIAQNFLTGSAYQKATQIVGLFNDMITGIGGPIPQLLGSFVTKTRKYMDNAVMTAAYDMRAAVDHVTNEHLNMILETTFGGIQNKLAALPARGSKALVDQFFSLAGGWDLKKGVVALPDGTYGFELLSTPQNAARLGRDVQRGDLLMNPSTGKAIVVDDLALDYLERFQIAAKRILADVNAARKARGIEAIQYKQWFVPPPRTEGKFVGYTFDANGKTLPGGAIIANTAEDYARIVASEEKRLKSLGQGHYIKSKNEIESVADMMDRAEMGWIDPSFIGRVNKGQTGAAFSRIINPEALQDSLYWVQDQVKLAADSTVEAMFDSQLKLAKARSAAIDNINPKGKDLRNIFDEWSATIKGIPASSMKPGLGVKQVLAAEKFTQQLIDSSWPSLRVLGANRATALIQDLLNRVGITNGLQGVRGYDDLVKKLGPRTPYANAMEYVEQTMRVSAPPEVRQITSKVNAFTASMLLRWVEFPNAIMNMLGIITNMPSILRSSTTPIIAGMEKGGKRIGIIDTHAILLGGFKDMLLASKHAEWDTMVKNGDTGQSIDEWWKTLGLIDSRSNFQKFVLGDANAKGFLKKKGIDGLVSYAADTTENMSRSWSHFVGLRLADANGIVGTAERHAFARKVANMAIADYNPLNRPEAYQTAFGSMFGLFSSYMQSYNQRMFRWMEVGDFQSVKRQLMMQGTMFGVGSMPGFNALESIMPVDDGDPDKTVSDMIYAKYGPAVGSVIAHGGAQEITRLFGGDTGIALYTRGDANLRAPTMDPTRLMAGLNTVESVVKLILETSSAMIDVNNPAQMQTIVETISRNLPNRAMKGTMEVLFNDGNSVDATGAIISDTQNWLESAMRMAGVRSTRQQGEIEAYYANTTMRRRQAGRMETLRNETRALIRSGKPFDAVAVFNKYVEKGGLPAHFKTWMKDQMLSAQNTRGMKNFVESLRSPNSQLEAWRYEMRQ